MYLAQVIGEPTSKPDYVPADQDKQEIVSTRVDGDPSQSGRRPSIANQRKGLIIPRNEPDTGTAAEERSGKSQSVYPHTKTQEHKDQSGRSKSCDILWTLFAHLKQKLKY